MFIKIKLKSKVLNGSDSNYSESNARIVHFVETKLTIVFKRDTYLRQITS